MQTTQTSGATTQLPRLATIEKTAEYFGDAKITPSGIRNQIFKAEDRINSRGEVIKGNGLAESGAIIRVGRKILIDLDRYAAWLMSHGSVLPSGKAAK